MKMLIFLILFFALAEAQTGAGQQIDSGSLVVEISGCENDDGLMMVALCNSAMNYSDSDSAFRGERAPIKNGVSSVKFAAIPFGEYAIKVFHDEDSDGELGTNFLGIPSESYGFSNNARGSFGPPSWDEAKFIFNQPADSVLIRLE